MDFEGKREALDFISKWEKELPPAYLRAWQDHKTKRDIVAKKLSLNEKDVTFISAYMIALYMVSSLKAQFNLGGNKSIVAATKGNTEVLELGAQLSKKGNEYKAKCNHFFNNYSNEIAKLNNNKR